ncbi:LUC7-domain-containing protein [Aulographum hederae CBS 113979]|uniref:LUC7-domain-containing protein n=1 Tax=Aulographum hederae CBS 113979 TaxID=1176131 RepID=A0A6G1GMD1_9PEZI|nr:LUC7-domain-containing protein [Aulographum hederae CBS 113979]
MAAEMRKMLEALMPANSMGVDAAPTVSITDGTVCHSYLVGSCPHDLFTNTRTDLGPCKHVHSEALKLQYEEASEDQKRKWGFDWDYQRHLAIYVEDCDRKIRIAQQRLEKTPEELERTNQLLKDINACNDQITNGLEEVEAFARAGHVNLAVQENFKLQRFHIQKEEKERELKTLSDTGGPSGHQKLQVCDTCGAYLSRLDNDRRLADHFCGKMHLGFASMRKDYERLKKELAGRPPPPRDNAGFDRDGHGHGYGGGGRGGGFRGGRGGRGGRGSYDRW